MTDRARAPKLTRRTVLGAVAGAGTGSLLLPAQPVIARVLGQGGATVFAQTVGSFRAGLSPAIRAPRRFQMAGLEWSAPAEARVQLRVRSRGSGRWGNWAEASILGHGPDRPARSGRLIGEGIWTGRGDYVQLLSSRPLEDVRLHYVDLCDDALRNAQTASLPLAQPVLDAGPGQPRIIARRAWAQGNAPPAVSPFYGTLKLGFVHHTENPNGYTAGEVPAMLLAIYQFHRYVRGWDDIGYNFVIDLFGRIWEARKGGVDEAVVGAQAGGYNQVSTGVAVLGTFATALPSDAALRALGHLMAWKLSLHGVPTQGRVTVAVNAADAFYTPFAPGTRVSLPRVAGHRDGDSTSCPGDALYARLPELRSQIAAMAGSAARLSLEPPPAIALAGSEIGVAGKFRQLAESGISGATIELQGIGRAGGEATIESAQTAGDGSWSAAFSLVHSARIRALHRVSPAAVSDSFEVAVAPAITLDVSSTSPLRVHGTVFPAKRQVTIELYSIAGGHRRLERHRRAAVRDGAFSTLIRLRGAGPHVVVARTAPDALNAAGKSPAVQVV